MSVDTEGVRRSLRSKVNTVTGIPAASKRQKENRDFKPPEIDQVAPEDAIWMRETLIPAVETPVAIGTIEGSGFVQYDIIVPKGRGTEAGGTIAKAIKDAFVPGLGITSGGVTVIIDESEVRAGFDFDDIWFAIPVRIVWRSYA